MKKILKWIAIVILGIIAIGVGIGFSPLLLLISAGLFWFFAKKKPNEKYKEYAKYGIIASAVGVVLLVLIPTDSDDDAPVADGAEETTEIVENDETESDVEETEQVEETEEEPEEIVEEEPVEEEVEEELTTQEIITNAVENQFEDNLIEVDYQEETDHYNVYTKTAGVSVGMDKNSANVNTVELLEEIQDEEFSSLYIEFEGEFVNDYGETSTNRAITYDISKETVDKINFDNFVIKKLPDVADSYWEHPAYR